MHTGVLYTEEKSKTSQRAKGGAFASMGHGNHEALQIRIAAVRDAKTIKSMGSPTACCSLTKDELDFVLEPTSEWARFLTQDQADEAEYGTSTMIVTGDEPPADPVRKKAHCVGAGVNRLSEGHFESRPYVDGRRVYCGRYSTYEDALAAANMVKDGADATMCFPGRIRAKKGSAPRPALPKEDVLEIRRMYKQGWTLRQLADKFGRGSSRIHCIVTMRNYKHVVEKVDTDEVDSDRPDNPGQGAEPFEERQPEGLCEDRA